MYFISIYLEEMIHNIFYSLVFFPYIEYDKDFFSYKLSSISEYDFWKIEAIFINEYGFSVSVFFTHKNFADHNVTIDNWSIESKDTFLKKKVTEVLLPIDQKRDFLFFEDKEFYLLHPFGVVLNITSKCNIFCSYCFNDYEYSLKTRNERKTLWLEDMKKIIDELYENGTRDVILTWGEPFTCSFLFELLNYLKDKNMYSRINTNGTLLTDTVITKIVDNYSLSLMVSFHEFNDTDYYKVNQEGAYKIYGYEGIKNFETKFSQKLVQMDKVILHKSLALEFLTILSPKNIIYLDSIFKFILNRYSLQNWHFFRLFSNWTTKGISRNMMALAIHKMYKLNNIYNTSFKIVDSVPFCVTKDTEKASQIIDGELSDKHNVKTIITALGKIQVMASFDTNVWDIFEDGIQKVWQWEFVQDMLRNGFLPNECQDCKYKEDCRWWSRMDGHLFWSNFSSWDPLGDIKNKAII